MYIEGHDKFGKPFKIPFTRILVYDDYGNVIAAVVKYGNGSAYVGRVGEKGFEEYLQALGLRNTTIVTELDPTKLPTIP